MERYARRCDATGCGMNEGYVVGDGELYFSEEQHLIKWLKGVAEQESLNFESDKLMLNHYYDEELYYYTEWEEIDDDVYYDEDGNQYEFKNLETMKYEIMTTNDGYMILDLDSDDYIFDSKGDNLWDTIDEVNNVLTNL